MKPIAKFFLFGSLLILAGCVFSALRPTPK
jgi:hypothetical protein